jgi:hypothetical protein
MLHLTGAKPGLTSPPVSAKPKRKRSSEPKPFEGLTKKPHCVLCEYATGETAPTPPQRPDPIPPTNRRPREVDTSMHFCPHTHCDYRGWLGLNNLRANGHPGGGPWRQFHCLGCNGFFPEHQVAYLRPAENHYRPLPTRLIGVNQPIISTRNGSSAPRPTQLAYI